MFKRLSLGLLLSLIPLLAQNPIIISKNDLSLVEKSTQNLLYIDLITIMKSMQNGKTLKIRTIGSD